MPLSFHTRLTDAQVAAIDAAATITDPRTGLRLSVSRQEVVSSILDAWIAQHAQPPVVPLAPGPPPAEEPVGVSTMQEEPDFRQLHAVTAEDVPVGVPSPSRTPTTKKAKAKAKAKKRPSSAGLDARVLAKVGELGPCSCAAVQKALAMANSTVYGALQRLVTAGELVKAGETYALVGALQEG